MNVPDDLLYTESHEWIRRDGDTIRVGITDHDLSFYYLRISSRAQDGTIWTT